jgi:hypothetical protein
MFERVCLNESAARDNMFSDDFSVAHSACNSDAATTQRCSHSTYRPRESTASLRAPDLRVRGLPFSQETFSRGTSRSAVGKDRGMPPKVNL